MALFSSYLELTMETVLDLMWHHDETWRSMSVARNWIHIAAVGVPNLLARHH